MSDVGDVKIIVVWSSSEEELENLRRMLREAGVDLSSTIETSGADSFHLEPITISLLLYKAAVAAATGVGTVVGKKLAEWAFDALQRKQQVAIEVDGQAVDIRQEQGREGIQKKVETTLAGTS